MASPGIARAEPAAAPTHRLRIQAELGGALRTNLFWVAFLDGGLTASADLVSGPWGLGLEAGYRYMFSGDGMHDSRLAVHLFRELRFAKSGVVRFTPTLAADLFLIDNFREDRGVMVTGFVRTQIEGFVPLSVGLMIDAGYGDVVTGELIDDHDDPIPSGGLYGMLGLYAAHDWLR